MASAAEQCDRTLQRGRAQRARADALELQLSAFAHENEAKQRQLHLELQTQQARASAAEKEAQTLRQEHKRKLAQLVPQLQSQQQQIEALRQELQESRKLSSKSWGATEQEQENLLLAFYTQHAPDKATQETVRQLLTQYRIEEIRGGLLKKYGKTIEGGNAAEEMAAKHRARGRMGFRPAARH